MELTEWSARVERVSAGYAEYYGVTRSPEWTLLKLTEEVGELTQAYLAQSEQGRTRGKSPAELEADLRGEVADVLAMVLVFAEGAGVDVEAALEEKWMPWDAFHARRAAGENPVPPGAVDPPRGPVRPDQEGP